MKSFRSIKRTLSRSPNPHNLACSCSPARNGLGPYRGVQLRLYSSELTNKQPEHVESPKGAVPPDSSGPDSPAIAEASEITETQETSENAESSSTKVTIRRKENHHVSTITHEKFRDLMRHVPRPVVVLTAIDFPLMKSNQHKKKKKNKKNAPKIISAASEANLQSPDTTDATPLAPETAEIELDLDISPTPRAMTLSSFSSLSIEPEPQVTFSVSIPSKTYNAIKSTRRFNIHVLADTAEGAKVAVMFSRSKLPLFDENAELARGEGENKVLVSKRNIQVWQSEWARYVQLQKDGKPLPYTPVSRTALPLLRSSAVLYVLRCILPRGTGARKGIIQISATTAIIVGNVEDYVVGSHRGNSGLSRDDMALSYVDQEYRKTGDTIQKFQVRKHVASLITKQPVDNMPMEHTTGEI